MEETLIKEVALWGIIAVSALLAAMMVLSAVFLLKKFTKAKQSDRSVSGNQKDKDITIGKAIISRIDRLDEILRSLGKTPADQETARQLRLFRTDLIGLLRNHSIEAFELENGTLLDTPTLTLIQVAGSLESEGETFKGHRISETVRSGYRYQENLKQPSTIVRKPVVRVR